MFKFKEKEVFQIIEEALELGQGKININSCPDNVSEWDSLGHLSLIANIEKKLEISFSQEEIVKMLNEKKIYSTILKK